MTVSMIKQQGTSSTIVKERYDEYDHTEYTLEDVSYLIAAGESEARR